MQADDIREQIEALREEVRGLSTSIINLRQDDLRKVFGDQIRPVLLERIERNYSRTKSLHQGRDSSEKKLLDLVERSVSIFQREGKQKALDYLEEFEGSNKTGSGPNDSGTVRFESQILGQIREYLMLSDVIFKKTGSDVPDHISIETGPSKGTLSPEAAERLLTPLSNARRVQVMLLLSKEDYSLAELAKQLDLKKGHLQFHLKALLDVDYIHFDRKSRLYSISPRGTLTLDGVTKIVYDLDDVSRK
jgi:DNA-binding transcriptional ArsR family regulator